MFLMIFSKANIQVRCSTGFAKELDNLFLVHLALLVAADLDDT